MTTVLKSNSRIADKNASQALCCVKCAFLRIFCIGLSLSGLMGTVRAATADPKTSGEADFTTLSLEELGSIKVSTVTGASKHEQKTTEAPSSVSIVSSEEIQQQGHRTLGDILRSVRGFYTTYDRGYNAIGVRGVNRPGDYGGRLLILVDGHRLNDPIYDTAASGRDFLLDVDLIETVEVIRGPGSSLYGNNAFFGVINVITRKGRDLHGAEVSGAVASLDTYNGRVSYGNKFTNGVEMTLSGTIHESEGNRSLYYPEFAGINNGVAEKMDQEKARSVFGNISWKGLSIEGGYVNRKKRWPTAPYSSDDATVIFNDPHFVTDDQRAFAELKLQHTFENEWELMIRAGYDHYQFGGVYPYDYFDPLQPLYLNKDLAQSGSIGTEAQVSRTVFEKHRVIAGVEARYDLQLDQKNFDIDPPDTILDIRESATSVSLYAQDEYQALKNLIINAGIRYDHFSTFGDTVNPRLALIFQPWEPATLKFLYGQAFRAPNAYENFYESTINKRNPALGPETIRSYEWVWEQKLSPHWKANASVFLNNIDGLIAYRQDPDDKKYFFDNVATVVTKGMEFELEGRWAHGLRGRASYAYSNTEDSSTGRRLANSPQHVGKLSLSVPVWGEAVFASLELQGMSERETTSGGKVGAAWLANTTLFSRDLVKGLEISASVYNLLDQHYRDPAAPDFMQDSIPQDGRSFRIKMTFRY